jgi:tetrahydromethanopterin S-methyltransferase subunit B
MLWAEKVYPHRNSMAGVVAFIYGFPVGLAVSLVIFAMVLVTTRRKMPKSAQK